MLTLTRRIIKVLTWHVVLGPMGRCPRSAHTAYKIERARRLEGQRGVGPSPPPGSRTRLGRAAPLYAVIQLGARLARGASTGGALPATGGADHLVQCTRTGGALPATGIYSSKSSRVGLTNRVRAHGPGVAPPRCPGGFGFFISLATAVTFVVSPGRCQGRWGTARDRQPRHYFASGREFAAREGPPAFGWQGHVRPPNLAPSNAEAQVPVLTWHVVLGSVERCSRPTRQITWHVGPGPVGRSPRPAGSSPGTWCQVRWGIARDRICVEGVDGFSATLGDFVTPLPPHSAGFPPPLFRVGAASWARCSSDAFCTFVI